MNPIRQHTCHQIDDGEFYPWVIRKKEDIYRRHPLQDVWKPFAGAKGHHGVQQGDNSRHMESEHENVGLRGFRRSKQSLKDALAIPDHKRLDDDPDSESRNESALRRYPR